MRKTQLTSLVTALLLLAASQAHALRANYAEVLVENLNIGANYNMTQLANLPLEVTNDSSDPVTLQIEPALPDKAREGFAAIPSVKWVKIAQPRLTLKPGETARTDILISVPNQKKYLGKKYEVSIWTHQVASDAEAQKLLMVRFGLKGRLLFTIAPIRQKQEKTATITNLDFMITPERVSMVDVTPGVPQVVKNIGYKTGEQPAEVSNAGDKDIALTVRSIDPKTAGIVAEEGYEFTPDPAFLTVVKDKFTLAAKSKEPLDLRLLIPDQTEYRGRKFMFLVSVATTDTQVAGQRHLRLMVTVAGGKPAPAAK